MKEIQRIVRDSSGEPCGRLTASVHNSAAAITGVIARLLSLVPGEADDLPFAILRSIDVDRDKRGQGFATAALCDFLIEARQLGAKLILLQIGVEDLGSDCGKTTARKLARLYRRVGFAHFDESGFERTVDEPILGLGRPEMLWMHLRMESRQ
jgi:GNAT superfamily N-acetyltransferase